MHDSAVAMVSPRSTVASATTASTVRAVGGVQRVGELRRSSVGLRASYARLRVRGVAGDDLELAVAQAGRDLQARRARSSWRRRVAASSDSGVPHSRSVVLAQLRRARRARRRRAGRPRARPATCPAARAAARAAPARAARSGPRRGGTTSPGAVPTGAQHRWRPRARSACLRVAAAVASGSSRHPARGREPLDDAARCAARARGRGPTGRPWKRGDDLGGEVVGGRPEPAAGDEQIDAQVRQEPSAARRSSGRSPTTTIWAMSTPTWRSWSASHGPLRSLTRPVSTSVPVTTTPARMLTSSILGRTRDGPGRAGRPGPCSAFEQLRTWRCR